MITVEKDTQITIVCTFEGQNDNEFFDFDVSKKGDVLRSENLYNELSFESKVLSVNYFIGETFVKGYSKILNCN
jgi:hypothetical protein